MNTIQIKKDGKLMRDVKPAGGMFDFNGDGITDPGESYLAFRIWEEMNGIREEGEAEDDGTEQGGQE